jgi:hypothetical protein
MARVALGAGALVAVAAVAVTRILWSDRQPEPVVTAAVTAPARVPLVTVEPGISARQPVRAAPHPRSKNGAGPSQAELELIRLEEEALRRIDVVPVLEAAGVDVKALRARLDAAEVMRHAAADEVLTRGYMRDYFASQSYPYGYPVERAMHDARASAEAQVAELDISARVLSLGKELENDTNDVPEPAVHPR